MDEATAALIGEWQRGDEIEAEQVLLQLLVFDSPRKPAAGVLLLQQQRDLQPWP